MEKRSLDKDGKILDEMYRRYFAASTPKGDWDRLLENASIDKDGRKNIPFMDYECDNQVMVKIIQDVLKENKVPKWRRKQFEIAFWLGCSPKSKL